MCIRDRFDALVKAEDVWGNPCERFADAVALAAPGLEGLPTEIAWRAGELAVRRLPGLRLRGAGEETRIAAAFGAERAESNLIRAIGAGEARTFWGDLHG